MGATLGSPVTSVVVKRDGGEHEQFRVGLAEMNGWRNNMEDAHVIYMKPSWGFFGVFDGHGGDQCSAYIASHLIQELDNNGEPKDDAAVKRLVFALDKDFLETGQASGSTGTFCIVNPPTEEGGLYKLRVGNVGDSRVLLGHADGTMYEGAGTDGGLTTDHKPDHPSERERIERTGGRVEMALGGVARVNGELAVSRAFGDAEHKRMGGPGQGDHPVSAEPEFCTVECDKTDFLMLVCDGISEGNFPNKEVIALAAAKLSAGMDAAMVAAAVCHEALKCNSKDNLSCMIVLFGGGEVTEERMELLPGPFAGPTDNGFKKAYQAMAQHAGMSTAQSVSMRYFAVQDRIRELESSEDPPDCPWMPLSVDDLKSELEKFQPGSPEGLNFEDREKWFEDWIERIGDEGAGAAGVAGGSAIDGMPPDLAQLLRQRPALMQAMLQQGGGPAAGPRGVTPTLRWATICDSERLKFLMEQHSALNWDDRLTQLGGTKVAVKKDDPSDGTSQISSTIHQFRAWVPQEALTDYEVIVSNLETLKPAIEEHRNLKWEERRQTMAGERGVVLEIDEQDDTAKVLLKRLDVSAWFPMSTLNDADQVT